MNEHEVQESDELEFCPICQVPLKCLKIIFTVHTSMCDVLWDQLPDCSDGIECRSASVFHYRDFSHKELANHRENLRKRKIQDVNDMDDMNPEAEIELKGSQRKTKRHQDPINVKSNADENDDDVFVSTYSKKAHKRGGQLLKTKKTEKPGKRRSFVAKCVSSKATIVSENCGSNIELVKHEENDVMTEEKLQRNSFVSDDKNVLTEERSLQIQSESENENCLRIRSVAEDNDTSSCNLLNWETIEETINETIEKKEKCKAEWNSLFKGNSSISTEKKEINTKNKTRNNFFSTGKDPKTCPGFKKMPGTGFAVDAFQFGNIPGVTTYFLTHFHSDHYIGLKKSFTNPIYCSLITANLVKKKLRIDEKYLHVLELNQAVIIHRVEVTFFDANHCPGSVLILFRLMNGEQFLHVGDFRACAEMEQIPQIQKTHIDRLYLDTTYFNPEYVFPTQKEVVERVKIIVRNKSLKHERALFISGTYLIGKEKVFIGMLEELQCKLWAQPPKVDVFRCINDPVILSALTSVREEAKVHVLPMNHLRFDKLKKYLLDLNGTFTHIFAFKPTGWEMGRMSSGSEDWINESSNGNITIYGVPYSEHSNYEELCRFVKFIKADKVIPTVTMRNRDMYGILKSIVDSYKGGPKQQSIQQFFNN